jgi:hypothetical protein
VLIGWLGSKRWWKGMTTPEIDDLLSVTDAAAMAHHVNSSDGLT